MKLRHMIIFEGIPYSGWGGDDTFEGEFSTPISIGVTEDAFIQNTAIVGNIDPIEERVEPFKNEFRLHDGSFRLSAKDGLAEFFLRERPLNVAEILSVRSSDDEDADLMIETNSRLDEDAFYYVDKTTFMILGEEETGSTWEYDVLSIANTIFPLEESDLEGAFIYDHPPFWVGRRVYFYSEEVPPSTYKDRQLRWVGKIDKGIRMDMGEIVIPCKSLLGDLQNISYKPDLATFRLSNVRTSPGTFNDVEVEDHKIAADLRDQEGFHVRSFSRGYLRIDDALVPYEGSTTRELDGSSNFVKPVLRSQKEFEDSPEEAREVFFVYRDGDEDEWLSATSELRNVSYEIPNSNYDTEDVFPYHVLSVGLSLLTARNTFPSSGDENNQEDSFNIFDRELTAELDWAIDEEFKEDVVQLIQDNPGEYYLLDHFLLWWDDEEENVFEIVRQLWLSYGFYMGFKDNGKLTVSKANLVDVEAYESALDNKIQVLPSGLLVQDSGTLDTTSSIKADVGKLPWSDGRTITVNAEEERPSREKKTEDSSDFSIDLDTKNLENSSGLVNFLQSRALIQNLSIPRLKCKVPDWKDENLNYSMGSYVSLEDLPLEKSWWVGKDGERIDEIDDSVEFIGLIVGRKFLPYEMAYELDIMLIGRELVRWRAPSGIVESYTEEDGSTGAILDLGNDSEFGRDDTDASVFTEGDEIMIYNPDGTEWDSEYKEVVDVIGSEIELDGDWSGDVPEGSIVELANLDSDQDDDGYWNEGLDGQYETDLVYFYLCDEDGLVGDAEDDELASSYG